MLVQRRFPGMVPAPQTEAAGRPIHTVIGDIVKRFLRATKPPARVGAGMGAIALMFIVRAALWVNLNFAAAAGIVTLYTLGKARDVLGWARIAVPLALLAIAILLAKAAWRTALVPFHHIALSIVGVCAGIEALLAGRVFLQLTYQEDVGGIGGTVMGLTDRIVAPFRQFEGSVPLHDTGVVEFATLLAIEATLILTIAIVVLLMFWSEFLHMYRRVRDFFVERAARGETRSVEAQPEAAPLSEQAPVTADLSAAS